MGNEIAGAEASPPIPRNRLVAAAATFTAGIVSKGIGLALIAADLSAQWTLLIGVLFGAIPKFLLIVTIIVLGKDGFAFIKGRLTPPHAVGPLRYRVGLVMFFLPFLATWIETHLSHLAPELISNRLWVDILEDLLIVTSLFVLGGDFWGKLRALFVYQGTVTFPRNAPG